MRLRGSKPPPRDRVAPPPLPLPSACSPTAARHPPSSTGAGGRAGAHADLAGREWGAHTGAGGAPGLCAPGDQAHAGAAAHGAAWQEGWQACSVLLATLHHQFCTAPYFPLPQTRLTARTREVEGEAHLRAVAERESGRLRSDAARLAERRAELAQRVTAMETEAFKAGERLDQFRLVQNWNLVGGGAGPGRRMRGEGGASGEQQLPPCSGTSSLRADCPERSPHCRRSWSSGLPQPRPRRRTGWRWSATSARSVLWCPWGWDVPVMQACSTAVDAAVQLAHACLCCKFQDVPGECSNQRNRAALLPACFRLAAGVLPLRPCRRCPVPSSD